jgi:hypothetical protein
VPLQFKNSSRGLARQAVLQDLKNLVHRVCNDLYPVHQLTNITIIYMKPNFRGLKKVIMVISLEGNGKDIPFRNVYYIYDLDEHGGTHGGLVGKIDALDSIEHQNMITGMADQEK